MVTRILGWAPLHALKVDENRNWKTGSPGGERGSERVPRLLSRGVLGPGMLLNVTGVCFDQGSHTVVNLWTW
jgi:hypothetical protein